MPMNKQELLFRNTYASLLGRIRPSGYSPTSVTGAYPGMFPRDASIQVLAHVQCGDYGKALQILTYLFDYHNTYGYSYGLHMILEDAPPLSDKVQTDTTFFLLLAWSAYIADAPACKQKEVFFRESCHQVKIFSDWFFAPHWYCDQLQLLRNPALEGPRLHSYFDCCDLLTNVCASQALFQLSRIFAEADPEQAARWRRRADLLSEGIHKHLTATVGGDRIYMEMHSQQRQDGKTLLWEPHSRSYIGFGWVNLFPLGIHWYAADPHILANTYAQYKAHASVLYFSRWPMLEGESLYRADGNCSYTPTRVLGKALAWELIYCHDTGDHARVRQLLDFIECNSEDMYRENWHFTGGGRDTANQEHASWMVLAVQYIKKYGTKDLPLCF